MLSKDVTVADPDHALGGQSNRGAPKSQLFKYPRLPATLLGITQKWIPLVGQESGFVGRTM